MSHSITRRSAAKSPKLPEGFPLWKHPSGRWCKKLRGKAFYFGKVADDPEGQAALKRWLDDKDDLLAGRKPRRGDDGLLTVGRLCNLYMESRAAKVKAGEMSPRTLGNYLEACKQIVNAFGGKTPVAALRPDDFAALRRKLSDGYSLVKVKVAVQQIRTVFKWGHDSELLDRPVRFGPEFKTPPERVLRKARRENGERMFEAWEIRAMLAVASVPFKAMLLLGVNCGFGNTDCATLPISALDLDGGWVNYPRPKTGASRRAKLWPETVAAIRAALANRPTPRNRSHEALVFITNRGNQWVRVQPRKKGRLDETSLVDGVVGIMSLTMKRAGIEPNGRGFYALRHVFETIGGESIDQAAVDLIMGHARGDMASVYRERISDDRLIAVSECIRSWLFGQEGGAQ